MSYKASKLAIGPWLGVTKARQTLCAIDGCDVPGLPHRCFADDTTHHHGCVHYESLGQVLYTEHKLRLRRGWGLLCDAHYKLAADLFKKTRTSWEK